jgi:predicted phosphodiesterase
MQRILVAGDVHLPYHSADGVALFLKVARFVRPTQIVSIGDLIDGYHLSTFDKDPVGKADLATEVRYAKEFIWRCKDVCKSFHITEGNHEERLKRVLKRVPELHSTHPSLRHLIGLRLDEWTEYGEVYSPDGCKVSFAHDLGKMGVSATRDTQREFGGNIVFGHTHRAETLYTGNVRHEHHVAMNVGHMCNPARATYASLTARAKWREGCGLVEVDSRGNGYCSFLPFINGSTVVQGSQVSL